MQIENIYSNRQFINNNNNKNYTEKKRKKSSVRYYLNFHSSAIWRYLREQVSEHISFSFTPLYINTVNIQFVFYCCCFLKWNLMTFFIILIRLSCSRFYFVFFFSKPDYVKKELLLFLNVFMCYLKVSVSWINITFFYS